MAELTVQSIVKTGLEPVLGAANAGGDNFVNNGVTFIEIVNGDGSAMTLTVVTQNTSDGLAVWVADRTISVPAGERRFIGPFGQSVYNNANGKTQLTYSAVTSLTVGAFKIP